uniref:DRBM domain-containing protein n=1 Tax=Timema douglasi TaxID=61478 RepID=A0A7R8VS74_TIMDO|nr:unnamed protein product [Timema douglasi]
MVTKTSSKAREDCIGILRDYLDRSTLGCMIANAATKGTTVGSGHSKKEAKHEAAKIALERIKETRTVTDSSTEILLDAPLEQVASPYEGNLHENAVGRLQEICMANNMPLAEYVMVSEEGPPHDKWFVFRCSVSKLAEISGARTKKQAKHLAAFKMVQTLQESLGSSLKDPLSQQGSSKEVALPDDKDTPMSENISKYGEVPGQYYKKVPVSQKISMLYLSLQGYTTESLTKLKEKFDTGDTDDYASLKLLFDQTLDELSVTSEWFDLPRECLVETPRLSEELNSRQSELEINGDQISEEFIQQTQLEIIVDKIREELNLQFGRLEIDSDEISEDLNPKLTRLDINGEQISEELNPKLTRLDIIEKQMSEELNLKQAGPDLDAVREQNCK